MALPGTQLANQVLMQTALVRKCIRKYTYVRANDRSYKLWGFFNQSECELLVRKLKAAGAVNPRVSRTVYGPSGVRFEMPAA